MTPGPAANRAERDRWNDPAWLSGWEPREQVTINATEVLLSHLQLRAGERLLEIGSGSGRFAVAAARAVGPSGSVTAVDFSADLLERARHRAASAGVANVHCQLADAQTDAIEGAPFDAVASQFGVMFFDDPVAAFVNLAAHVVPRGRLGFVCWQVLEANPWCLTPVVLPYLAVPPTPSPGPFTPGPFAFGDPEFVSGVLAQAGWGAVERTPYERRAVVEEAALLNRGPVLGSVPEERRAAAEAALEQRLGRFARPDGRYEVPLAFHVFTARRR